MKRILILTITILIFIFAPTAIKATTLTGGISLSNSVPEGFFGAWKVAAVRSSTTNQNMFIPYSIEIWNLMKDGNVITLENPVSGASASISVKDVSSDAFTFQRITGDNEETVVETAKLFLDGNSFVGADTMVVKTYQNGKLVKTENAEYKLKAIKISNSSIKNIFGI